MIDVGEKERTSRIAVARAELRCSKEALKLLNEGRLEKGDALAAARISGIMAAKHTPALLPLCHTIALAGADVDVAADEPAGLVRIEARVHAIERTGGAGLLAPPLHLDVPDLVGRQLPAEELRVRLVADGDEEPVHVERTRLARRRVFRLHPADAGLLVAEDLHHLLVPRPGDLRIC